jgi:hypothetical protein
VVWVGCIRNTNQTNQLFDNFAKKPNQNQTKTKPKPNHINSSHYFEISPYLSF